MNETLCWECKNAICGCSWAENLIPVEGWTATPTKVKGEDYTSYCVTSCPLFKPDDKRNIKMSEIAKKFNISEKTLFRRLKANPKEVKAQLRNKGYELIIIENEKKCMYYARKVF